MNNGFIDKKGNIQDKLKKEIDACNMLDIGEKIFRLDNIDFKEFSQGIIDELNHRCNVYQIKDASKKQRVKLNTQLDEESQVALQALWGKINAKTMYSVNFNSEELIKKCSDSISKMIKIEEPKITAIKQRLNMNEATGITTKYKSGSSEKIVHANKYLPDIINQIQNKTNLTRKTVISILLQCNRLDDLKVNAEKFIEKVIDIIQYEIKEISIAGIKYEKIDDYYSMELLSSEDESLCAYLNDRSIKSTKSLYDYIVCDSDKELEFAQEFEENDKVKVYVKLPSWFKIETPVGTYNPDWAIVIEKNGIDSLYFVVETKGTDKKMDLRPKERHKIDCAEKHFEALQTDIDFKAPVSRVKKFLEKV